ncbi:hexameric tyrosine-coordinated heme protein [Sphingosinicella sp. BN140058]|uniref:hexameric tyrosine-coordinated heme protein n=1 Tax=Sphingosinicella sp. BN140058 TaxID=1892855 RepID=UPI0010106273|nr:hexameric tyrosine-coordinated heme protein [Sphingosinicella sp. BN140058]QAY78848.1 peroxidase [Sphingosinicella sp. BN140058]
MSGSDPFTLITPTPEAGFDLAVRLARLAVKMTQPSPEIRTRLRAAYEQDSEQLIAASQVTATHFQTIAAANEYWRVAGEIR